MFASTVELAAASTAAGLHTELDALLARDLTRDTGPDIVALWADIETFRNRLAALDHALIAQIQTRRLDVERGASTTIGLARILLRVSAREAKARVHAADAAGPRTALTGEPLPPIYGHVAAAQADGAISPVHAALVVKTIEQLPGAVQEPQVEEFLVEQAREFTPDQLARIAERLSATLDPDGRLKNNDYRRSHRELTLTRRADGSGRLTGELTAELAEHLDLALTTYAAPTPETGGVKDPRTGRQRRHDALLTILQQLTRCGAYPDKTAGVSTTVILTSTLTDWVRRTGTTTTGHGGIIPTPEAVQWTDAQTRYLHLILDPLTHTYDLYGATQRLFTEAQRYAMTIRDKGCTFPGCDTPPQRCQAHHIQDWDKGGPTSLDNATLICGHHHRNFEQLGWTCAIVRGIPTWTPPAWLRKRGAA